MIKQRQTITKTSSTALTLLEIGDILCNSINSESYTLPTASLGLWYRLTNINVGVVTIGGKSLEQGESCLCINNGSTWYYTKGGGGLTSAQMTDLTDGGYTVLHKHNTVGSKEIDETEIADGYSIKYDSDSGKLIYSVSSSGSGGSTWYNGNAVPTTEGVEGDYYLDLATGDVYVKGESTWGIPIMNIKGSDGLSAIDFYTNGFTAEYGGMIVGYRFTLDGNGLIDTMANLYNEETVTVTRHGEEI